MHQRLCICSPQPATYLEEQEQLKADFHRAVGEGEDADEGDSLLTPRKKDKEELLVTHSDHHFSWCCHCKPVCMARRVLQNSTILKHKCLAVRTLTNFRIGSS